MSLVAAPFGSFWPTLAVAREDITPPTRGPMLPIYGYVLAQQRLPTDSVGTTTLTLTNLVVGSAVRLEIASTGVLVELRTAASTSEDFTVPYYTPGSSNNDLRIKVRKGSAAPLYKPYETLATVGAAAQSVYIAQIED